MMKNPIRHPRTKIREDVAALLSANLPKVDPRITDARISIHRSTPLFAAKLPAILIYTRDERIESEPNADPGLRYRKLELSIEIITSGDKAAEEADSLAQAVEFVMETNETLGNTIEGIRHTGTEIDQDGEGDTPILAARLMFEVSYWTQVAELPPVPVQPNLNPEEGGETTAPPVTTQIEAPSLSLEDVVTWAKEHVEQGGTLTPDVIAGWQEHLDEQLWKRPTEVLGSWAPKIGIPHEPDYQDIDLIKSKTKLEDAP